MLYTKWRIKRLVNTKNEECKKEKGKDEQLQIQVPKGNKKNWNYADHKNELNVPKC